MTQLAPGLHAGRPVDNQGGSHAAFVSVALVHTEGSVAQVCPTAAGAGGPAAAPPPLCIIVHSSFRVPAVLAKETAPIVHAGAGHTVIDHEQDQRIVESAGRPELLHHPTDILVHAIDDCRVECHLQVQLIAQPGVIGFPLWNIQGRKRPFPADQPQLHHPLITLLA